MEQRELEKLRVGIGRIAQQLGIESSIPGYSPEMSPMNYEQLCLCARVIDRGWNSLLGAISSKVGDLLWHLTRASKALEVVEGRTTDPTVLDYGWDPSGVAQNQAEMVAADKEMLRQKG